MSAKSPINMNEAQRIVCDLAPELLGYPQEGLRLANEWGSAWLHVRSTRPGRNWFRAARLEWADLYRLIGNNDIEGLKSYIKQCLDNKPKKASKRS